jgi:hypothetical protein
MYYCNSCGQCNYISDDNFIENVHISGSETRYIDCITGDVNEYGDTDTDSTGDSSLYCPHCDSDDVNSAWEPEDDETGKEEALARRKHYDNRMAERKAERAKAELAVKIKNSDWDLGGN